MSRLTSEGEVCPIQEPDKQSDTAERLRFYRCQKALRQQDVAAAASLSPSTYLHYENGLDYYPPDRLDAIAAFLGVDVTDLLDAYNRFLRDGQGPQVKTLRRRMKLTQKEFAKRFGVRTGTVKRWESGSMRMTKKMWEKVFGPPR